MLHEDARAVNAVSGCWSSVETRDRMQTVAEAPHRSSTTRLTPSRDRLAPSLRELWGARELVGFLIQRDLRIRYKQAVLGAGWALLQPLVTMVVFSVFFGRLAHIASDGVAYPLFSL